MSAAGTRPTLEEIIAPAVRAYRAAIDTHERIEPGVDDAGRFYGRCLCGWTQERGVLTRAVANRAAGLHESKAAKRASREYDVQVAELLEAATR